MNQTSLSFFAAVVSACGPHQNTDARDVDAETQAKSLNSAASQHLAPLTIFLGHWRCQGEYFDVPPIIEAHAMRASMYFSYDIAATWLKLDYAEKKTAENPRPHVSVDHLSIEVETSRIVHVSLGNNVDRLTSSGPVGDGRHFVLAGVAEASGASFPFEETISLQNDNQFLLSGAFDIGAGPQTYASMTCTRTVFPFRAESADIR